MRNKDRVLLRNGDVLVGESAEQYKKLMDEAAKKTHDLPDTVVRGFSLKTPRKR